jgi:deoxyribose-phosphate aldolase
VDEAAAAPVARLALACLDLTSLNDADTDADVERLCERAQTAFGLVAAVCVWPRFAGLARRRLPASIRVAAVANFPDGGTDIERARRDVAEIVAAGAQEVDVVMPYCALLAGNEAACVDLLAAVRRASEGLVLKVILETGVLHDAASIRAAADLALDAGADFLKTSTGKTAVSATPQAAQTMLDAIVADPRARDVVGFKAAGGIRSVADAARYVALVRSAFGTVTPQRFRIGASGLIGELLAVLGGATPVPAAKGGY